MIVLDTHVWIWWVSDPERLSARARRLIRTAAARGSVYVSSISAWEVALLVARGRLRLTMEVNEWVRKSEALPFLHFVPVDNAIALRSASLPEPMHTDPADRIVIATALSLEATVVSRDSRLLAYPHVKAIW